MLSDRKVAALICLVILLFMYKLITNLDSVVYSPVSDIIRFSYPMKLYEWQAGYTMPFWNAIIYSGTSLIGNIQASLFYPPNILYALLPMNLALNYNLILNFLIAALSMYAFARYLGLSKAASTFAPLAFVLSEQFYMRIYAGHLIVFDSIAWIPLSFLLLEMFLKENKTRSLILLSFVLSLQILGGHIQFFVYNMIALVLYAIARNFFGQTINPKPIGFLALSILLSLALTSIQLLPFTENFLQTTRATGYDLQYLSKTALQPEQALSFLVPEVFGGKGKSWGYTNFWEYAAYLGALPLILAAIAVVQNRNAYVKAFLVLSLFAVLFSFFNPIENFRYPARFLIWYGFALSMLAAFGMQKVMQKDWRGGRTMLALLLFSLALLAISGSLFIWKDAFYSIFNGLVSAKLPAVSAAKSSIILESASQIFENFSRSLLTVSLFYMVSIFALIIFKGKRYFGIVLLSIFLISQFSYGLKYVEAEKIQNVFTISPAAEFLKNDKDVFRVYSLQELLPYHEAAQAKIELTYGYDPMISARYENLLKAFNCLEPCYNEVLYKLLNVKYAVSIGNITSSKMIKVFDRDKDVYLFTGFLPRAYIVYSTIKANKIVEEIVKPDFNPVTTAVVEEQPNLVQGSGDVEITEQKPGYIKFDVSSTSRGLVVLSEQWNPGWKVYYDGKPAELLRTNYAFIGAVSDKGEHTLTFAYEPDSFKIGAIVTFLSILLVLFGFYFRKF